MAVAVNPAVLVVSCLVCIVGCFGNGTLIFLVAKHKQLKTMRNAFLLNIAVADILAALSAALFAVTVSFEGIWIFGLGMCRVHHFLYTVYQAVAIFTLTFLSVERCVKHFNPSCGLDTVRNWVAATILVFLWLIPLILGIPDVIFAELKPTFNGTYVCFIHPPSNLRHMYQVLDAGLKFAILLAIPLLITAVSFSVMFFTRKARSRPGIDKKSRTVSENEEHDMEHVQSQGTGTDASGGSRQRSHGSTKLVLALVLVYVICWLPIHVYQMWFFLGRSGYNNMWAAFKVFADCMCLVDCCLRAWVVFGVDPTFKHYFKTHLCCCFYKRDEAEIIPLDDQTALPAKGSFKYA
ncbi:neuropeptide CCHamide-2 receptor-like [Lineus longissimus]|uniref:neuropeptide CCHamide-2 receptor-like n=1 Tax=Lineus longissimus TaxID=88925 RepID=UPI00315D13B1